MENYYFSILFNDISKYDVLISLPIYDLLNFFWINFIVRDNSVSLNIDGDMSLVSLLNSVPLTHTHTHTHTLCFHVLWGLPLEISISILYKLYLLSPYTNPTPKPTHHRKLSAFVHFQKKTSVRMIDKLFSQWD